MNLPPDTAESETTTGFFRCPVQADQGKATVRIGRRKIHVTVQETSIDGYTVLVKPKQVGKLKVGPSWKLDYEGAKFEVHPQWFFNAPDGHVQMGLRRLRDLTKPEPMPTSWLPKLGGPSRYETSSSAAAVYGGFMLVLFSVAALPGLGEKLGTAQHIQGAFRWVLRGLDQTVSQWM